MAQNPNNEAFLLWLADCLTLFTMSIWNEIPGAVRSLKQRPGVTLVILLALGLGIGVNASCFISVNAVILHPMPYPNLERIATLWESPIHQRGQRGLLSVANFLDLQKQSHSFEYLAAYQPFDATLSGIGEPERLTACAVSAAYFDVLGSKPITGRVFRSDEMNDKAHRVAIVSEGFWKRRLAGAPDAVGKAISLNGEHYSVIGIMPHSFNFPLENDVWVPLQWRPEQIHDRQTRNLAGLGLLSTNVSANQARVELAGIAHQLATAYPEANENRTLETVPILELNNDATARFLFMLLATAGFVLLLACANAANLHLVRLADRQTEIAIRTALGATRAHLAAQLITESLLLSLAAGTLGLLLADWSLGWTKLLVPDIALRYVPGLRDLRVDWTVALFTLAASIFTGLLCSIPGSVQVLRGAGTGVSEALKEVGRSGTAGRSQGRLRIVLAISEMALALVLLACSGAMVQTFQRLLAADPGFNRAHLLTLHTALAPSRYPDANQMSQFLTRLQSGVERIPQVRAAAVSAHLSGSEAVWIEGRGTPIPGETAPAIQAVSADYFRTLELPLLAGRPLMAQDNPNAPLVAVISESVRRHYWPDQSPIGAHIRMAKNDSPWLTVVGVAGDVKNWFNGTPLPIVYVSYLQHTRPNLAMFVRTSGDPLLIAPGIRAAMREADPNQPIFDLKTMEQQMTEESGGVKAAAVSMGMYAVVALLLAVTGIYAVIAYSVSQRTHEIGIRMALGADRADVLTMTLGQALRVGLVGLCVGLPLAYGLLRVMSNVLFGVVQVEPLLFVEMAAVLTIAALFAGFLPALRASRLDPLTALRNE